jgi:hypothetical protein
MSQASLDAQQVLATFAGLALDVHNSSFIHNFKDDRSPMLTLGISL